MNEKQLERFSRKAASGRAKLFGTRIIFREIELVIPKPTVDPTFILAGGGYREGAVFSLRFPSTVQPPPYAKEKIEEVGTGRKYSVTTCDPAPPDCAQAHEHIVNARIS